MIENIYIILPVPNNNASIWDIVVQSEDKPTLNKLGTKMIVKLYVGDDGTSHAILNGVQKYTHAQIMVELQKAEWNNTTQ